ncbi:hypothetical protein H5410_051103 [Solanum commersonii]|uniref:Putative plant transposon protein domain-containing protein n=1 Tax=Solanum commersonii TaxID=4109 RepID=A0A9J5WZI6_SOLCO|nr:hypothetical protein H5410_051103 [Solanum commersonii]
MDARCRDNMSSKQRSSKVVASSSHKRVRTGTTITLTPTVLRGQTQRYRAKAITTDGKKWYKSHTKDKYFLDVIHDDVQLEREFPCIMRRLQELHMGFIFQDPTNCNVSVVREFYANWKPDARSHFVTVHSVEGNADAPSDVLTGLNISPPYQKIRYTMCGAQSTAKWIRHGHGGYHQSYPYAHMNRKARVWLKIIMNYLIPGLHFTEVTMDRVCLVYALMKDVPINIGPVLRSAMRKAKVHQGRRNGCSSSTEEQLDEIASRYPLNEHVEALLGLWPTFLEPVWDDVPTDEGKRQTMSDNEFECDAEEGQKIEAEVVKENGQEVGKYTRREHLRIAELKLACRK